MVSLRNLLSFAGLALAFDSGLATFRSRLRHAKTFVCGMKRTAG